MKNKINLTKQSIFKIIFILVFSFLLSFLSGYLVTSLVNQNHSYYQVNFVYEGNQDLSKIVDKEYLQGIKSLDQKKYASIDINKLIDKQDFTLTKDNNNYTLETKCHYYDNFFFVSQKTMGTRAKTFIKLALTNYVDNQKEIIFEDSKNIVTLQNHFDPYIGGSIALGFGLIIASLLVAYLIKNKDEEDIEDNETLFHTPFHKGYWKESLGVFKDTKKLVTLAMLFSLLLVSKLFHLPSGFGNLGIGLAYLFLGIIALIYGPLVSLIIGFLSDTLGFFITGQSFYYFGYTIQAMLASLTYALCFYKTKVTFTKVLSARLIVNLLLNVVFGSYLQCRIFVMGGTLTNEAFLETFKAYMLLFSLPKNLIYLLPQSIVLYLIFKLVIPILVRFNLVDSKLKNHVTII